MTSDNLVEKVAFKIREERGCHCEDADEPETQCCDMCWLSAKAAIMAVADWVNAHALLYELFGVDDERTCKAIAEVLRGAACNLRSMCENGASDSGNEGE